jgi:hypothetical protein
MAAALNSMASCALQAGRRGGGSLTSRWHRPTDTEEGRREVGSSTSSAANQIEIEDDHLAGCVPGGDKGAGLRAVWGERSCGVGGWD